MYPSLTPSDLDLLISSLSLSLSLISQVLYWHIAIGSWV
jgi:hypothetical protein